MAIEIDALELSVQHNTQTTTSEIDRLVKSLEQMRDVVRGGAGLKGLATEFEKITKSASSANVDKMESSLRRVVTAAGNASMAMQEYVMWAKEAKAIGISVPKISASAGVASPVASSTMESVADGMEKVSTATHEVVENIQDLGVTATQGMGELTNGAKEATEATEELKEETKKAAKSIKMVNGPVSSLAKSFLRIAKMRMIRAILRGIVTALKEGITNLYYYSQAVNNADTAQAAKTMDSYASALLKVKNSVGAALMPIIQAALPIIQTLTNAIVTALNMFNKFVSAITGHSTWTYAVDSSAQFASNLSGASGAAKELKKTIMGFDELNILNGPSNGGGGGGSAGNTDYGSMFTTEELEPEYLAKIKRQLEPIVNAFEKLQKAWEEFSSSRIGNAIVTTLEWFIRNGPALTVITSVANSLSYLGSVFEFINTLLTPSEWSFEGFVRPLSEALKSLGDALSAPQLAGLTALNKGLGSLFGKEDGLVSEKTVKTIARVVSGVGMIGFLGDALGWVADLPKNIKKWGPAIKDAGKKIKSTLKDIKDTAPGYFESAKESAKQKWESLVTWVGETFAPNLAEKFRQAKVNAQNAWNGISDWFQSNVSNPIVSKFNTTKQKIQTAFTDAKSSVQGTWMGIQAWFEQNVKNPVLNVFNGVYDAITRPFRNAWEGVKSIWEKAQQWFRQYVIEPINGALNAIRTFFQITIDFKVPHLTWDTQYVGDTWVGKVLNALNISPYLPKLRVNWYANGGIVPQGDLFFAGERGPELVGSMGGQSAVANQGQIVDGISRGVYNAMMSAMSQSGGEKNITIQIGDTTLASVVTNALNAQTRRLGYSQLEGI